MVELLLAYLSMAVLAILIAESELSFKIKKLFYLHIPSKEIQNIGKLNSWYRFLGEKYLYILSPIVVVFIILARAHQLLMELLNCPICTSVWLGVFIGLFFGLPLKLALIYGFICTAFKIGRAHV